MKKIGKPLDKDTLFRMKNILSVFLTVLFGLYHLLLGMLNKTRFNQAISAFYFTLAFLRILILFSIDAKRQKTAERLELLLLLFLDLTLVIPVILMLSGEREVSIGTIPAIANAAYTTFKITTALTSFFGKKEPESLISKHVKLHDSLLSVLVLQNTLILTFQKGNETDMKILSCVSSAVILLFMFLDCIRLICQWRKKSEQESKKKRGS